MSTLPGLVAKTVLTVTSPSFAANGDIPARFTCDGEAISPALHIGGLPGGAQSLVIIVHDPDAPRAGGFTHWMAWNIPPMADIPEGFRPGSRKNSGTPSGTGTGPTGTTATDSNSAGSGPASTGSTPTAKNAVEGKNSGGKTGYTGPCPPSGTHHYHFRVYALDTLLPDIDRNAGKDHLEQAMAGHILAEGDLVGLYTRTKASGL